MATRNEHNSPRWRDESQLPLGMSRAKLLLSVNLPGQIDSVIAPASGAEFRNGEPGTRSTSESLAAWGKAAGDTLRSAIVSLRNDLMRRARKRWLPADLIALNDLDEWNWSRERCRVVRQDERVVVWVGMHDHDISKVEAAVHKSGLAIRVHLGCGRTLRRAEPLPAVMQEAITSTFWDREGIRIELQAVASVARRRVHRDRAAHRTTGA
jgi:hypothetical protein